MSYSIVHKCGHYEIHINGKFYCSADTWKEATDEVERYATQRN